MSRPTDREPTKQKPNADNDVMLDIAIDCRTATPYTPKQLKDGDGIWKTAEGRRRRGEPLSFKDSAVMPALDIMEHSTIVRKTKKLLDPTAKLVMMVYDAQTTKDGPVCGQRMVNHALQARLLNYTHLRLFADYEMHLALISPDPSVRDAMANVINDGPLVTTDGVMHEIALQSWVKHVLGDVARGYDMTNLESFKKLFLESHGNVCCNWKGRSLDHWACSVLYSNGRLWEGEGEG